VVGEAPSRLRDGKGFLSALNFSKIFIPGGLG
jgi:hypothetical protein